MWGDAGGRRKGARFEILNQEFCSLHMCTDRCRDRKYLVDVPYCLSAIVNHNAAVEIENIQEREVEKVSPGTTASSKNAWVYEPLYEWGLCRHKTEYVKRVSREESLQALAGNDVMKALCMI